MDMSKHPTADAAPHPGQTSLPGEPHNRDLSNPGETWAFVLAAALIGALAAGYATLGLPGIGLVMVALVPVLYVVLVMISVGR